MPIKRGRRGNQHPEHVQALINTGAQLPSHATIGQLEAFKVHCQGDRGTCCAHGVTAAHELVTGRRFCAEDVFDDAWDDESKRTIGDRFSGALVRECSKVLAEHGQRELKGANQSSLGGAYWKHDFVSVPHGDVRQAQLRLLGGSPIAVGINCFGEYEETKSGDLTLENHSRIQDPEWHCIVLVGYEDCTLAEGGGWLTFVNSWGSAWGQGGFGRMSFGFYEQHCYEAFAPVVTACRPIGLELACSAAKRVKQAANTSGTADGNRTRCSSRNRPPTLPAGALLWRSDSLPVFDTFDACWSFLASGSAYLPEVRPQDSDSNCVHFSCWAAMECLCSQSIDKPKGIFRVAQKNEGLALLSFYEQDRVVRALAAHGFKRTILDARVNGAEVAQAALVGGGSVLLLGLNINMFDHDSKHVRDPTVKRGGRSCMLAHCVACIGYVTVASKRYFVLRDTQPTDLLGYQDSGLSLVAVDAFGGEGAELVLLTRQ